MSPNIWARHFGTVSDIVGKFDGAVGNKSDIVGKCSDVVGTYLGRAASDIGGGTRSPLRISCCPPPNRKFVSGFAPQTPLQNQEYWNTEPLQNWTDWPKINKLWCVYLPCPWSIRHGSSIHDSHVLFSPRTKPTTCYRVFNENKNKRKNQHTNELHNSTPGHIWNTQRHNTYTEQTTTLLKYIGYNSDDIPSDMQHSCLIVLIFYLIMGKAKIFISACVHFQCSWSIPLIWVMPIPCKFKNPQLGADMRPPAPALSVASSWYRPFLKPVASFRTIRNDHNQKRIAYDCRYVCHARHRLEVSLLKTQPLTSTHLKYEY